MIKLDKIIEDQSLAEQLDSIINDHPSDKEDEDDQDEQMSDSEQDEEEQSAASVINEEDEPEISRSMGSSQMEDYM